MLIVNGAPLSNFPRAAPPETGEWIVSSYFLDFLISTSIILRVFCDAALLNELYQYSGLTTLGTDVGAPCWSRADPVLLYPELEVVPASPAPECGAEVSWGGSGE